MAEIREVRIPDVGDVEGVDVAEVLVEPGDRVAVDDSLIILESDKASMDVPSPYAGTVQEIAVKAGDAVQEDGLVLTLEVDGAAAGEPEAQDQEPEKQEPEKQEPEKQEPEDDKPEDDKPEGREPGDGAEAGSRGAAPRAPELPDADVRAEVLVLGSGPGGYTAAFRAADLGRQVVLVERYGDLGGVCLNVGCIPSKALLHLAKVIDEARAFGEHGVAFGEPELDLEKIRGWKDGVVARLTGGIATMADKRKVEVVHGMGRFTSDHTLQVVTPDGPKTVAFERAILAAGSRVTELPGLPYDDRRLMDSTSALDLDEIPERLLIVGGGIIGLEMATVYHALGSKITVVELLDRLMAGCDKDIVRRFQRFIEKRYENIFLGTKVSRIESETAGLKVSFEGPDAPGSEVFDRVLVAVGRRPNGDQVGAEAAGLEVDERGFIPVDRRQRTNVPHIFAIGDLAGEPMLAHKASHEGKVAAEVAAGHKSAFDARAIPSVAYTDPEVAWVGITEEQAKERGLSYGKGNFPWSASGRSLALGRSEGMTKMIFDQATKRVIGAAIVGPGAGELIAEVALAIEMGCEAQDVGLTVHPHPTLSETVAFAAEAFEGTITDLYLPRRK